MRLDEIRWGPTKKEKMERKMCKMRKNFWMRWEIKEEKYILETYKKGNHKREGDKREYKNKNVINWRWKRKNK